MACSRFEKETQETDDCQLSKSPKTSLRKEKSNELRSVGVEYLKRTQVEDLTPDHVGMPQIATLTRDGRIILCTGALKTPKILYMSGIAESEAAHDDVFKKVKKSRKPPILLQVPGLGRVFDHVGCSLVIRDESKKFKSFNVGDYQANSQDLKLYTSSHSGPYSIYGPIQSVRMRVNHDSKKADVEAFAIPNGIGPVNSTYSGMNDFSLIFQLLNTTGRNRIVLDENEYLQFNLISQQNETLNDDLRLAAGVFKVLKTIHEQFPDLQVVLGPGGISHGYMNALNITDVEEYVKGKDNPLMPGFIYFANLLINHFGGSVALGTAVDEYSMILKGTSNVHVAGGSVMPLPVGAHPIFTIMMVAEKASDMIGNLVESPSQHHRLLDELEPESSMQ